MDVLQAGLKLPSTICLNRSRMDEYYIMDGVLNASPNLQYLTTIGAS